MGRIIVAEFVSLDGVIESPGPDGSSYKLAGWTIPYSGEDIMKFKAEELFASGALLLGNNTYQGFAKAWPTMEGTGEFGEKMNSMPKYIVSGSLVEPEWNNSHVILPDEHVDKVQRLKSEIEGDILVNGSSVLVKSLASNGLIDAYRLLVYPIVLGSGKKLFTDDTIKLKLVKSQPFDSGVVLLEYSPDTTQG
jgi:dihydrofolate reductase